jgi:hypothetical protein
MQGVWSCTGEGEGDRSRDYIIIHIEDEANVVIPILAKFLLIIFHIHEFKF